MMFFGQSFYNGGFFGGAGAAGGWGIGKILCERDPEEVAEAREAYGAIPEAVQTVIAAMAKLHAMDAFWDEEELQDELRRRLPGVGWSSHFHDALMEALDDERARLERLAGQMRHFRIAPCQCGTTAQLEIVEGDWQVQCQCGEEGPLEEQPAVAIRSWNHAYR